MPRPCKRRRICSKPACGRFGPKNATDNPHLPIAMTLDEYETIRLIDLEGLTQEQCAAQMHVSRTTVQAIYGNARLKLATCLVQAGDLVIEGGEYILCDKETEGCGRRCCHHTKSPS